MQGYADLTSPKTRSSNTGTPPETVHYYLGRDRLLEDGKRLLSEHISGPFYDPETARVALATCGDSSTRVVKVTTFVQAATLAGTSTTKAHHGFEFDMADGLSQFLSGDEVLQAPWYPTLPLSDREHIEHWAAHFKRHGWDA